MNVLFFLKPKNEVSIISDNTCAEKALNKMQESGFSSIPVVNDEGKLVGTLTEGDLLYLIKDKPNDYKTIRVKEIMNRVTSRAISINAKIEDLIFMSLDQNFIPVVDDNDIFIGIVTRKNILQYCYDKYIINGVKN